MSLCWNLTFVFTYCDIHHDFRCSCCNWTPPYTMFWSTSDITVIKLLITNLLPVLSNKAQLIRTQSQLNTLFRLDHNVWFLREIVLSQRLLFSYFICYVLLVLFCQSGLSLFHMVFSIGMFTFILTWNMIRSWYCVHVLRSCSDNAKNHDVQLLCEVFRNRMSSKSNVFVCYLYH